MPGQINVSRRCKREERFRSAARKFSFVVRRAIIAWKMCMQWGRRIERICKSSEQSPFLLLGCMLNAKSPPVAVKLIDQRVGSPKKKTQNYTTKKGKRFDTPTEETTIYSVYVRFYTHEAVGCIKEIWDKTHKKEIKSYILGLFDVSPKI